MAIQIEVKLYGALRQHRPPVEGAPHHPFSLSLPQPATVETLLDQLSIPSALVNIVSVNGETTAPHHSLQDGDEVRLFPPTAGG